MEGKVLRRPYHGRQISGVCAGIGNFLGLDPVLIRLLWVLLTIFTAGFGGLIAYIAAAMIIPNES